MGIHACIDCKHFGIMHNIYFAQYANFILCCIVNWRTGKQAYRQAYGRNKRFAISHTFDYFLVLLWLIPVPPARFSKCTIHITLVHTIRIHNIQIIGLMSWKWNTIVERTNERMNKRTAKYWFCITFQLFYRHTIFFCSVFKLKKKTNFY